MRHRKVSKSMTLIQDALRTERGRGRETKRERERQTEREREKQKRMLKQKHD